MSLALDARQRAMLQEMGITIWQTPQRTPDAHATAVTRRAAAAPVQTPAHAPQAVPQAPETAAMSAPAAPFAAPVAASVAAGHVDVLLRAPVALYPGARADATPAELGNGWLVVIETATTDEPLAGESGKLLDNMLRAMQLHLHPRTFACVLERNPGTGAASDAAQPVQATLAQALAELRPAMVLVLGLGAARAVLDSREPLGRLRAVQHQLADGTPATVSYDPAYLLRAPDAKAAAWADLCRALAVVRLAA